MRNAFKQTLFRGLAWSGANALARHARRDCLAVLNYHGVLDDTSGVDVNIYCNTVSTAEFAAHLEFITRFYHPVRASEVERWAAGLAELPPRAVLLTFDDGLRNNLTHAAPLLKQYGVPAIVFLATAYIGGRRILWPQELYELALRWPNDALPRPGGGAFPLSGDRRLRARDVVSAAKAFPADSIEPWIASLRAQAPLPADLHSRGVYAFLNWEEARQLPDFGMEIGSHTVNHPILTRCDAASVRRELAESKREIETRLRLPCGSFCYPNGGPADWSDEIAAAVKDAGYKAAFTLSDRLQRRGPVNAYAIDRLMVPGGASQPAFQARLSGNITALRRFLG